MRDTWKDDRQRQAYKEERCVHFTAARVLSTLGKVNEEPLQYSGSSKHAAPLVALHIFLNKLVFLESNRNESQSEMRKEY